MTRRRALATSRETTFVEIGPVTAFARETFATLLPFPAVRMGWDRWLGERGGFVGMHGFGASGAADELYRHFGITAEAIVQQALALLD